MSFSSSIALLFLFEMNVGTFFSPIQSNFWRSLSKSSLGASGRAIFFATSLYQVSSVTELWCADIPVSFAYYITDT